MIDYGFNIFISYINSQLCKTFPNDLLVVIIQGAYGMPDFGVFVHEPFERLLQDVGEALFEGDEIAFFGVEEG